LPTWISHKVPGEPFSRTVYSRRTTLLTHRFISPLSHSCHQHCHPHAWLPHGFVPFLSLSPHCRPRLEVLNASQNSIRYIAGLSLLPSLVVLNLGKWRCLHKSARGSNASVMRSLQRRPSPTAPHDVLSMADSAAIPPWKILFFSSLTWPYPPP
jgi:hypothetical protein